MNKLWKLISKQKEQKRLGTKNDANCENTPFTIQLSYKYYLILSMLIGGTAMMGLALTC
jgi:hypothetical protein